MNLEKQSALISDVSGILLCAFKDFITDKDFIFVIEFKLKLAGLIFTNSGTIHKSQTRIKLGLIPAQPDSDSN